MKKRVFVAAVIVVCIAMLAAGTLAYFTDEVETHNIITSGEIDISLFEQVEEGAEAIRNEDGEVIGYRFSDVLPGKTVQKQVQVLSNTAQQAWVRVQLSHTITKDGKVLPKEKNGVEMVQYTVNSKWVKIGDWYYYPTPLNGGSSTEPVIETVKFAEEMDNAYQNATVTMDVKAQAVQVKNNPIPEGGDLSLVAGWPSE